MIPIDVPSPGAAGLSPPGPAAAGPAAPKEPQQREQAARELESLFLSLLSKELRKSLGEAGLFGQTPGSSVYEGIFDRMLGEELARGVGVGLRRAILSAWPEPAGDPRERPAAAGDAGSSAPGAPSEKGGVSQNTTPATKPVQRSGEG